MSLYWTRLLGVFAGSSGAPLRFASAQNFFPNTAAQYNLGTGALQSDIYQVDIHTIGVDVTSIVVAIPMQCLVHNQGIKNMGNGLNVQQLYVNYNGVTVAATFGGLATASLADTATLFSDPIPSTSFAAATKFAKGTTAQLRWKFTTTAPTTDFFPTSQAGFTSTQSIYLDPLKANVTNGPSGTGAIAYSMINGGVNGTDAKFGNRISAFVLGAHTAITPMFVGDSKTFGTGDTPTGIGAQGMSRTLFADATLASSVVWPGINFGCPSGNSVDCYTVVGSGSLTNFEAWYAYGTHAIIGYGTNGLVSANQTTLYGRLRAKGIAKLTQRSLTPRTTSSDLFATIANQTDQAGWSVGGTADTYEATLRGFVATDAALAYYQSTQERASATLGTTNYWIWAVNGTSNYATSDGTHETAIAYELNVGNAGSITTQAGGTVAQSLRAWVAALT